MKTIRRRRAEGRTDYQARINMLKSGLKRIVFRRTNTHIIGQCVSSKEGKDQIKIGITSEHLIDFGWPKENTGSLKSITASYLTGYLLGKKIGDIDQDEEYILDIGLNRNIAGSRIYAFAKGVVDSGIKLKTNEKVFPNEDRINGKHLKIKIDVNKIKENINKKFK